MTREINVPETLMKKSQTQLGNQATVELRFSIRFSFLMEAIKVSD
jgi:hypothetical protein